MKLYVVRHGQTEWNVLKKMQGFADIPLNEKGKEQAEETKLNLGNIHFDMIFLLSVNSCKANSRDYK